MVGNSFTITRQKVDLYTRENSTQKMRRQRAQKRGSYVWRPPEFVCVDGEGQGEGPDHKYVLLGVGARQYENPDGLHWSECFDFLYSQFESNPRAVYVGFFLSYDFNQIIKTMPEDRAQMLLTREGMAKRRRRKSNGGRPFPVRCDDWEFDMLPGRRLMLRPLVCECDSIKAKKCDHKRPRWMYVCDAGAFWQTSLLNVLNPTRWETPICTEAEYASILEGKARRSDAVLDDDMRRYNRLENELFARAMGKLAQGFHDIDVHLSRGQWFGPGQAAAAWMREFGVPKRHDLDGVVPDWFMEAAKFSYYGGWFEIFRHGILPGMSYEYDLNSAYPYFIADLPCLLHGSYSRGTGDPPDNSLGDLLLVLCTTTASNGICGAMPHRSKSGSILRPVTTRGWHWADEVTAGIQSGVISDVEYHEWRAYAPCDCMPPARRVRNLYERRLAVGKNSVLGIAAKLVYNSMYGKFAQATGESPYGNWVYASRVTSGCRAKILEAIGSHPGGIDALLMVATDGVFFDRPHNGLALTSRLGDWEETKRQNLTQFKPGMYWDDSARDSIRDSKPIKFKARGVNAKAFSECLMGIDEQFLDWCNGENIPEKRTDIYIADELNLFAQAEKGWPSVVFESGFNMVSALQALQRGDWKQAGKVSSHFSAMQTSMPYEKRCDPYWDSDSLSVRSRPRSLQDTQTVYYNKSYGMDDPFSQDYVESRGVHFDGPQGMMFNMAYVQWLRKGEEA